MHILSHLVFERGGYKYFLMGVLIHLFCTSGNGFQSQGGSLSCMLCQLCAIDSSDSPLGGQHGSQVILTHVLANISASIGGT